MRGPESRSSLVVVAAAVLWAAQPSARPAAATEGSYVHVVLDGTVDLGMAPLVHRALREAREVGADRVFIEINTLGGRVDAAVAMRDALLTSDVPTVAYVNRRAISAGALIALATTDIDMAPGATLGAATPVQIGATGAASPVDAKTVSYMRKEFAATAEARSRDALLAEAMVDAAVAIEGVSEGGELLTLTTDEALRVGLASRSSPTVAEALEAAGLSGLREIRLEMNWAEAIARMLTHPVLSGLLLTAGFLGIMFELKSPGWGVPGSVGAACLFLFFAGHYVVLLAGWEDALLVMLGLVLIALEVFVIPGFGVAGLAGMLCLGGGVLLAMVGRDWQAALVTGTVGTALTVLSCVMVGTVGGAALILRYLPESRLAKRTIVLASVLDEPGGSFSVDLRGLIGETGTARTVLRPSGTVSVGGRPLDAVAEGQLIDAGRPIVVVDVRGGSVVVREPDEPAEEC